MRKNTECKVARSLKTKASLFFLLRGASTVSDFYSFFFLLAAWIPTSAADSFLLRVKRLRYNSDFSLNCEEQPENARLPYLEGGKNT